MSGPGKTDRLISYLTAILLFGAAVFLIISGNTVLGLGALCLAGLSWFTSRRLLRRQGKPDREWLLDERLLQTQKLAAMGELAAGVAHEINNPLAIIRQEAEWTGQVLRQAEIPETPQLAEVRDSLREIVQQVDRARDITAGLLNLARKREPVIQKVDLNRLIRDMAALVEKEAKASNIQVIRRLQEGLPLIESDAPLLRQVILNLLNNARQAVGKDGSITISTRQAQDRRIVITIADTGSGIPPELIRHIFDPFFTTKEPGTGTGLGLAISRGIIHSLGGDITAASRAGEGAEFTISLPLRPETGVRHAATA
ncbi:MAG: ATP-binding protein [Deltaproteobacteria bacterium]|nr:ATP-binding protein [Deltaproteobacteria bacterium]